MTHEQQLKKQGTVNYKPPANDPLNRTLWLDRAGNKSPGLLDPGFAFEPKTLTYRTGRPARRLRSCRHPRHSQQDTQRPQRAMYSATTQALGQRSGGLVLVARAGTRAEGARDVHRSGYGQEEAQGPCQLRYGGTSHRGEQAQRCRRQGHGKPRPAC